MATTAEYQREYRKKNRERCQALVHKSYAKRADYYREKSRIWKLQNPEKVLNNCARRRAVKVTAIVENVDREVVFDIFHGVCGICYNFVDPLKWHLDHIIPLSKNGSHSYSNCQVTHPHCNLSKNNKIID